jgi:hypothetical protein
LLLSPSGRYLIYGVSRDRWPALEVLDLSTGARLLFHAHACDPAWGRNDQIAYHYLSFDSASGAYTGRIMVQRSLGGTPSDWTGDAAWASLIWAGSDLLANEGAGTLVIVDGPGHQRAVDGHRDKQGPLSTVIAVSPKSTEALVDTQRLGPGGGGPGSRDFATLIRVSDGAVVSTAQISRNETGEAMALAPGAWIEKKIIATGGVFEGGTTHPPAALVTLAVAGNRVQLRSVKPFLENGSLPMAQNPAFATQPSPLDPTGNCVAVWFGGVGRVQYLACNTLIDRCNASRDYGDPWSGTTTAFASNPSRP